MLEQLRALERLGQAFRAAGSGEPPGATGGAQGGTWGHLRVEELLGEGSFGEVYRAHDTVLDRPVALKLSKAPPPAACWRRRWPSAWSWARRRTPPTSAPRWPPWPSTTGGPWKRATALKAAVMEFQREGRRDDEALSQVALARALSVAGEAAAAKTALERGLELARQSQSVEVGEAEASCGHAREGRARLAALEKEARQRGLVRVADQAARSASGSSARSTSR